MNNLDSIIEAINFIERNLKNNIKVDDIATKINYSTFYFQKLFKLIIGDSPGQYIKKRRLYEAALELQKNKTNIIDIAFKYNYESPEAFSRAFTRFFGLNPIDIKINRKSLIRYAKPKLTIEDINHIHNDLTMEPRIETRDSIKIIGPVYYGNNENNEIPNFWKKYFKLVSSIPTKIGTGSFGFCYHDSKYIEKGLFYYMPSVEVENFSIIPKNTENKTIPKHKYAIFTHKGDASNLEETYKYIHGTWFPHKIYKLNENFDFEYYTTDENGNDIVKIFIPIIDKRGL